MSTVLYTSRKGAVEWHSRVCRKPAWSMLVSERRGSPSCRMRVYFSKTSEKVMGLKVLDELAFDAIAARDMRPRMPCSG